MTKALSRDQVTTNKPTDNKEIAIPRNRKLQTSKAPLEGYRTHGSQLFARDASKQMLCPNDSAQDAA